MKCSYVIGYVRLYHTALRGNTTVEISKNRFFFISLKDALNFLKHEAKSPIPEKKLLYGIPRVEFFHLFMSIIHFKTSKAFFSKYDFSKRHAA